VREITRAAKANLGAVTYHFGSKSNLYLAVLDRLMGDLSSRITAAAAQPGTASHRIGAVVHAFFSFFADHPEAPRLMIRELARGEPPPAPVVHHVSRNLQAILSVMREGQATGELRAVEPILGAFSIISQPVWFALARRNIAAVSGVPLDRDEFTAQVERHIVELVSRGLAPERSSA
jgi:AcrR family transcriptional regulator